MFEVSASGVGSISIKGGIQKLMNTVVDVIIISDDSNTTPNEQDSNGAGFIIDKSGYILTNCHVIDSAIAVKIATYDGREYRAKIIGKDSRSDIALLKIDSDTDLPCAQLANSDRIEIGDPVIAIGNPFGLGKTVTSGIVSFKGRDLSKQIAALEMGGDLVYYLQTDAAINGGNSGGPLFSYNGEVVGMITVFLSDGFRSTGINFAIPSNMLKRAINELKDHGKLQRSWIGISVSSLTRKVMQAFGFEKQFGCVITMIDEHSPAANAGLQVGDILVALNDEFISENTNLEFLLNNLPIGKVVSVQIIRNGVSMKLSIRVGVRGDDISQDSQEVFITGKLPREKIDGFDLWVTNLTLDLQKKMGIPENVKGVIISHSMLEGMKSGCIILSVNQVDVSSVSELRKMLYNCNLRNLKVVAFYIYDPMTNRRNYVAVDVTVDKKVIPVTVSNIWKNFKDSVASKLSSEGNDSRK
jgi:serine protease Do